MARKLAYIAQDIMNLYNQDYKATTDFFDIDDFVSYAGMSYTQLLSQEYELERQRMRQERDDNYISFSHDWLQTQIVKVILNEAEGYIAELQQQPLSFPYDKWDSGIQNVFPEGRQFKGELIRGTIDDTWYDDLMPIGTTVVWRLLQNKLIITAGGKRPPNELKVIYVPCVSESLEIPQTREKMIMDLTIDLMIKGEQKVIKETNDQNINPIKQTETNMDLLKQIPLR